MEDLVQTLTRGNATEVKLVLVSVAAALAAYQLLLIAVTYGRLRLPFLAGGPAGKAHRASGDAIVVLLLVIAFMCLVLFGFDDDGTVHAISGAALIGVLALKIAVLRRWHGLGRHLPVLGLTAFTLLAITWATTAGSFLAER